MDKENGNRRFPIIRIQEKCYGCRTCELACSFHHERVFAPALSSIHISRSNETDITGWRLDSSCDSCAKEDYPPRRYMEEPIGVGPYAGHKCDKDKWDEMLDKFYALHGWDIMTGLQTLKCLNDLGLEDIAARLAEVGRLAEP